MKNEDIISNPPRFDYHEEASAPHPQVFDQIVRSRRSVRKFLAEPIPESIVREVLRWGLLAPTSSNLQCWEFHWVQDAGIKKQLDTAFMSQPACTTAPTLLVAVARTKTWDRNRKGLLEIFNGQTPRPPRALYVYYEKLVPLVYGLGPLGILGPLKALLFWLVGWFRPVPREPVSRAGLQQWAVKTTALACENIMLGFSAHGYDTCPMEGFDSLRVRKILGLPRDAVVVMGISAGRRAEGGIYGPRVRLPEDNFIKVIGAGN